MTLGIDPILLSAGALALAWAAMRRARKAERAARETARAHARSGRRVADLLRRLSADWTPSDSSATAAEIEALVASGYAPAVGDPEDLGEPESFDRLTDEETHALQWERDGSPDVVVAPGGVAYRMSESDLATTRELLASAKKKSRT